MNFSGLLLSVVSNILIMIKPSLFVQSCSEVAPYFVYLNMLVSVLSWLNSLDDFLLSLHKAKEDKLPMIWSVQRHSLKSASYYICLQHWFLCFKGYRSLLDEEFSSSNAKLALGMAEWGTVRVCFVSIFLSIQLFGETF